MQTIKKIKIRGGVDRLGALVQNEIFRKILYLEILCCISRY